MIFSLCFSILISVLVTIAFYLAQADSTVQHVDKVRLIACAVSVSMGIFWGLVIGWNESPIVQVTVFIRHFILRFILWLDSSILWNYARFLDYCTERLLLQRIGGRYRFIHKLLQDHFAAMPLERE
jgi:hypothetical protein